MAKGGSPLSRWHDIAMTEISSLVLCWRKVSKVNLPSPKHCILFFNCGTLMQEGEQTIGRDSPLSKWHDITITEISSLVLCWRKVCFAHLPSSKYCILFFIFGTLMQEGEWTMGGDSPLSKWHDITMTEISSLVLSSGNTNLALAVFGSLWLSLLMIGCTLESKILWRVKRPYFLFVKIKNLCLPNIVYFTNKYSNKKAFYYVIQKILPI